MSHAAQIFVQETVHQGEAADAAGALQGRADEAGRVVRAAEAELDAAVAELAPVQDGDKRVASEDLSRAFEKLMAARSLLAQLGRICAGQDGAPERS